MKISNKLLKLVEVQKIELSEHEIKDAIFQYLIQKGIDKNNYDDNSFKIYVDDWTKSYYCECNLMKYKRL